MDFYVPEEGYAIQVSYSLADEGTRKRELSALQGLHKIMPLQRAVIVTYDEEDSIELDGLHIDVVPVWKWLLDIAKVESASFNG